MLSAPAASRNKEPILEVLKKYFNFTDKAKCLEIASGTGEHAVFFARSFPHMVYQPSDILPRNIHSIVAYIDNCKLPNIRIPLIIDATKPPDFWALPADFGPGQLDLVLNINMMHISSQDAVDGLFRAAGDLLKRGGGRLITYGPYMFNGVISPQSNVDFDAGLRKENSDWGLRDVEALKKLADHNGLALSDVHNMPANNYTLVFSRR